MGLIQLLFSQLSNQALLKLQVVPHVKHGSLSKPTTDACGRKLIQALTAEVLSHGHDLLKWHQIVQVLLHQLNLFGLRPGIQVVLNGIILEWVLDCRGELDVLPTGTVRTQEDQVLQLRSRLYCLLLGWKVLTSLMVYELRNLSAHLTYLSRNFNKLSRVIRHENVLLYSNLILHIYCSLVGLAQGTILILHG